VQATALSVTSGEEGKTHIVENTTQKPDTETRKAFEESDTNQ
jgi:hypothetical protein